MNGMASPWRYWNAETGCKQDHGTRQFSNGFSSCQKKIAWQNFRRQDSDSSDPQLYSFEDYVDPNNSCEPLDCRRPGVFWEAKYTHMNRADISDSSYGEAFGDTDLAKWTLTSNHLTAALGQIPSSTDASLKSLHDSHRITHFFSTIPLAAHLGSFHVLDAADTNVDAELTDPLYYTTPPLSQIPHRCAIKHKRKLIRSSTSLTSILAKTSAKEKDASITATDDCKPTEKYNNSSVGSLGMHLADHNLLTAIRGSLSLPSQLNEESNGLKMMHFKSEVCPYQPTNVALNIISRKSLLVSFYPPNGQVTADLDGYIVEWSRFPDFIPLSGSHTVTDVSETSFEITDLRTGMNYYVQVKVISAGCEGPEVVANPSCAVPSDWRDIDCASIRTDGKREILDDMYSTMRNALNDPLHTGCQFPKTSPAWKNKVRCTFMNLFTSTLKFYRSAKNGVYLATVVHHKGRVLVTTNDGVIPVIEIDSNFMPTAAALNADLQWLTKITCNWCNVKMLRQLLQKMTVCDIGSLQFRRKLLQGVLHLQTTLGIKDLGQLYQPPMRDPVSGAYVLTIVCCLNDSKLVNTSHFKWMSLGKLLKRSSDGSLDQNLITSPVEESHRLCLSTMLLKTSNDMIAYYTGSCIRLSRGLYLGYLKLGSSLDEILVMAFQNRPNTLPNVKIRDNSHVSREEWLVTRELVNMQSEGAQLTEVQETFRGHLKKACSRLFNKLGMEESKAMGHRLYHFEVLEFSPDVSMIVVLPAPDQICTGPGQTDETPSTCINLPIYTFEMFHMRLYHLDLLRRYSQLSSCLEIEIRIAQQEFRMGISKDDIQLSRRRVDILTDLQQRLENSWREMRWIVDLAMRARDKKVNCGVCIEHLFNENIII